MSRSGPDQSGHRSSPWGEHARWKGNTAEGGPGGAAHSAGPPAPMRALLTHPPPGKSEEHGALDPHSSKSGLHMPLMDEPGANHSPRLLPRQAGGPHSSLLDQKPEDGQAGAATT